MALENEKEVQQLKNRLPDREFLPLQDSWG